MSDTRMIAERGAVELTKRDFDTQALAMLPQGFAWTTDPDGTQPRLMRGLIGNHYRAYQRIVALLDEADPRTTYETIGMWEIDCDLPDPCVEPPPSTLEGRRAAVIARRQTGATTTPLQFVALAATLGYTISITEFRPFRTWSRCNDFLNPESEGWPHVWRVDVLGSNLIERPMRCDSPCTAFLREWETGALECIFERIKPAQTFIIFAYETPP